MYSCTNVLADIRVCEFPQQGQTLLWLLVFAESVCWETTDRKLSISASGYFKTSTRCSVSPFSRTGSKREARPVCPQGALCYIIYLPAASVQIESSSTGWGTMVMSSAYLKSISGYCRLYCLNPLDLSHLSVR